MNNKIKNFLAIVFYYTGISYLFFRINVYFSKILVVNYHCTPLKFNSNLEYQIKFFKKFYTNMSYNKLLDINKLNHKTKKPFLIITFDDGLRSNYDNALPILKKYGFSGWFFICPKFINNSSLTSLNEHSIYPKQIYGDNRYCMNKSELLNLLNSNYIGSHTFSHYRIKPQDSVHKINNEIVDSKVLLEKELNFKINSFAWVGGEEYHYTKKANKIISKNYSMVFTTLVKSIYSKVNYKNIPRTNIENTFSKEMFLFQISGILDLVYIFKRKRVSRILNK